MTKVIGLTGGIGSGKSTVARMLRKLGAAVIDTDKLAHDVYQPGTIAWNDIVDAFGRQVLTPGGEIDRVVLGRLVFKERAALNKLNDITHPGVLEQVQKLIEKYRRQNTGVVVIEVPLLIEAGWHKVVDIIWVVTASKDKVIARLKKQRNLNEKEIALRANVRLSEAQLIKHADVVMCNDGTREHLKKQVAEHWLRLTKNHR